MKKNSETIEFAKSRDREKKKKKKKFLILCHETHVDLKHFILKHRT